MRDREAAAAKRQATPTAMQAVKAPVSTGSAAAMVVDAGPDALDRAKSRGRDEGGNTENVDPELANPASRQRRGGPLSRSR